MGCIEKGRPTKYKKKILIQKNVYLDYYGLKEAFAHFQNDRMVFTIYKHGNLVRIQTILGN